MKKLAMVVFLIYSTAAYADSACDKPRDDFDGLYCRNKVYQEADRELNENYKKLYAKLDNDGKEALKAGQLAWIEDRNNKCSRHEGQQFFVNLNCATNTTNCLSG